MTTRRPKGWYHDVDHNEDAARHAAQRARDIEAFGEQLNEVVEEEDIPAVAPPLPPPPPEPPKGNPRRPI